MTSRLLRAATSAACVALLATAATAFGQAATQLSSAPLATPPQDRHLPYTRSAYPAAIAAIKDYVAVFPGSRYGYVRGLRTRLDSHDLLGGDAVVQDGKLMVPADFAGLLQGEPKATPMPADLSVLADRWVYDIARPPMRIPAGVAAATINGTAYVSLKDLAGQLKLPTVQTPRGLLLVSTDPAKPVTYDDNDAVLSDDVVTLFDTPDTLADPDIATKYVPLLARQGKWTDHVRYAPEQVKLLQGPPTVYPTVPVEQYDYTGFNQKLLGSAVPPPGVFPRLLFSQADVPMLLDRLKASKLGQMTLIDWDVLFHKSWWNPGTDDAKLLRKLASGDTADLKFAEPDQPGPLAMTKVGSFVGYKPGIFNTHVNYYTNSLTSMALYCLLTGDDEHGAMAAHALVNYYRLIEPIVEKWDQASDSEWGTSLDAAGTSRTNWRGMHGLVNHMDLPFALDFAGKWMNEEEKHFMETLIAEATYGRRGHGESAPARMRDVNWITWDLPHYLACCVIEGLPGCDPEGIAAGRDTVKAFCDWGIDEDGQIFETNGKNGGGIEFQTLSMIVTARRGLNLWGHPHWRKLLDAQALATAPNGQATVSPGTWGGGPISPQMVVQFKAFYPGTPVADYLLTQDSQSALDGGVLPDTPSASALLKHGGSTWDLADLDPDAYRAEIERKPNRLRLPGPTYPNFTFTGIYDTDWKRTDFAETKLPLVWNDTTSGELSVRTDATPDAAWMFLYTRANQYCASGHFHSDIGLFYFSALGVNWFVDNKLQNFYDGKLHNQVMVDGVAEPDGVPARGLYLGATVTDDAAFAAADLTQPYSYRWTNQVIDWDKTNGGPLRDTIVGRKWELCTDPYVIAAFRGMLNTKFRPWWPSYVFSNYVPVCQSPWNPVKYAFRTVGLLTAPHPVGVVADDVDKGDGKSHEFTWTANLGTGVWAAGDVGSPLPGNMIALAHRTDEQLRALKLKPTDAQPAVQPGRNEPLLLVCALGPADCRVNVENVQDGPADRKGKPQPYERLAVTTHGTEGHYRLLFIPIHMGQALPAVKFDPATHSATVTWPDGTQDIAFDSQANHATTVRTSR